MLYLHKMPIFIFLLFNLLSIFACKKEEDFASIDDQKINAYLQSHQITNYIIDEPSGIYYQLIDAPENIKPLNNSEIEVAYTYTIDQSLPSQNSTDLARTRLKLDEAIIAWQLILPKFSIGTKALLFVPSRFAYGNKGLGTAIPPNTIMVFYIELLNIHPSF